MVNAKALLERYYTLYKPRNHPDDNDSYWDDINALEEFIQGIEKRWGE